MGIRMQYKPRVKNTMGIKVPDPILTAFFEEEKAEVSTADTI